MKGFKSFTNAAITIAEEGSDKSGASTKAASQHATRVPRSGGLYDAEELAKSKDMFCAKIMSSECSALLRGYQSFERYRVKKPRKVREASYPSSPLDSALVSLGTL
jgi:hypothetical protein